MRNQNTQANLHQNILLAHAQASWYSRIGFYLFAPRLAWGLLGYQQNPTESRIRELIVSAKSSWIYTSWFEQIIYYIASSQRQSVLTNIDREQLMHQDASSNEEVAPNIDNKIFQQLLKSTVINCTLNHLRFRMERIATIEDSNEQLTLLDQLTDNRQGLSILWHIIKSNVTRSMFENLHSNSNNPQLVTLIEQGQHTIISRSDIEQAYTMLQSKRNALTRVTSTTTTTVDAPASTSPRPTQNALPRATSTATTVDASASASLRLTQNTSPRVTLTSTTVGASASAPLRPTQIAPTIYLPSRNVPSSWSPAPLFREQHPIAAAQRSGSYRAIEEADSERSVLFMNPWGQMEATRKRLKKLLTPAQFHTAAILSMKGGITELLRNPGRAIQSTSVAASKSHSKKALF